MVPPQLLKYLTFLDPRNIFLLPKFPQTYTFHVNIGQRLPVLSARMGEQASRDISGSLEVSPRNTSSIYLTHSRLFDCNLLTVLVGPQERSFKVHETVLCRSPVLAAMCSTQFIEGTTRIIRLPEDDPDGIVDLLKWLYDRALFTRKVPETEHSDREKAEKLLDAYVLADKYAVMDLQEVTRMNLFGLSCLYSNAALYFDLMDDYLPMIRESDN